MTRLEVVAGVALAVGLVLVLAEVRWFARRSAIERLRPYVPGAAAPARRSVFGVESFQQVIGPLAQVVGDAVARVFGVSDELAQRLRRIRSPLDVAGFRTRQVGLCAVVAIATTLVATVTAPPPVVSGLLVVGAPVLAFLVQEQSVTKASQQRQRRTFLELPIVAEQLGMLLAAGYSLGSALQRLAGRGDGVVAEDLRTVVGRIRQGLTEAAALREWAESAQVDGVDRLVSILALNRSAVDLGGLIHDEARALRREVHRELLAQIERRAQQVWIPVTVATLVPGVMFIAVPFVEALRLFTDA